MSYYSPYCKNDLKINAVLRPIPSGEQLEMVSTDQLQIATIVHNALYNTGSLKLQNQACQFISDDCEFVNPVVQLYNKNQLHSKFGTLTSLSPTTKVHAITSANHQVMIDCTVTYTAIFSFSIRHVTKMTIKGSQVALIEDVWSVQDLILGLPVLGSIYGKVILPGMGRLFSMWGRSIVSE